MRDKVFSNHVGLTRTVEEIARELGVSVATTDEQRRRVFAFRYSVYIEEQGKPLPQADHMNRLLRDDWDEDGLILFTERAGEIESTVRLDLLSESKLTPEFRRRYALDLFPKSLPVEAISYTARLMVRSPSRARSSGAALRILCAAYHFARERGVIVNLGNCAEMLLPLFERFGCRAFAQPFTDPDVGYRVPIVQLLEDLEHFEAVGSPLLREAKLWVNRPEALGPLKSNLFERPSRPNLITLESDFTNADCN